MVLDTDTTEIRRCNKCLLPEYTPGIAFNAENTCNICETYRPPAPLGKDALLDALTTNRDQRTPGFDCIVPVSGGLDSLYTAYYLVKILGLKCKGVYYDNGMLSGSGEEILQWIEDVLDITITRKGIPSDLSRKIVRSSLVSLSAFGPKYMQAGLCRHCGYGIRATVFSEMVKCAGHSVWGMHTMDELPFRYCLNVKLAPYILQRNWQAAAKTFNYRYKQIVTLPSPGQSALRLLFSDFGYPRLPKKYSRLKQFSFFDYIPWNKTRMLTELQETGIDTGYLETAHSDCLLSPIVDFILRRAWGIGKKEVYICNRVRAGQLSREQGLSQIEAIGEESLDTTALSDLGMSDLQIASIFEHQP